MPKKLKDHELKLIESALINGYTVKEIAEMFGMGEATFRKTYIANNARLKIMIQTSVKRMVSDAYTNIKKLADGYFETEKSYKVDFNFGHIKEFKSELIACLESENWEGFRMFILEAVGGEPFNVEYKERYYPPDRLANQKILEAHNQSIWDTEAKRKAIPNTVLHITVGGKAPEKRKQIKADYTIEG